MSAEGTHAAAGEDGDVVDLGTVPWPPQVSLEDLMNLGAEGMQARDAQRREEHAQSILQRLQQAAASDQPVRLLRLVPTEVAFDWSAAQTQALEQALGQLGERLLGLQVERGRVCFGPSVMATLVQRCPQLRRLLAGDCPFDLDTLEQLGEALPQLEVLHLGSTSLKFSPYPLPAEALSCLSRCRQLRELVLDADGLGDEQLMEIARGCGATLQKLGLVLCDNVTEASIVELASHSPHLQELSLSICRWVGAAGIRALGKHCPELRVLNLGSVQGVTGAMTELCSGCPRLTRLYLSGCTLLEEDLMAICTRLPVLADLDLNGFSGPPQSAYALLARCPTLERLILNGCKLPTERFNDLCELLAGNCVRLRDLDLNNSTVGRRGVDAVAAALPECAVSTIHCKNLQQR